MAPKSAARTVEASPVPSSDSSVAASQTDLFMDAFLCSARQSWANAHAREGPQRAADQTLLIKVARQKRPPRSERGGRRSIIRSQKELPSARLKCAC